jgi:hypothetical protein
MLEAMLPSETPVLTRGTLHNIPGDGILFTDWCENLKSYVK